MHYVDQPYTQRKISDDSNAHREVNKNDADVSVKHHPVEITETCFNIKPLKRVTAISSKLSKKSSFVSKYWNRCRLKYKKIQKLKSLFQASDDPIDADVEYTAFNRGDIFENLLDNSK